MANETYLTIRGWAAGSPIVFDKVVDAESGVISRVNACIVRVGVTANYYSRAQGRYVEGTTVWYAVRTYGALAQNVARCVGKGTPVLVRGKLITRTYQDKEGLERTENVIMADSVGIELSTGVAHFAKVASSGMPAVEGEESKVLDHSWENRPEGTDYYDDDAELSDATDITDDDPVEDPAGSLARI